MFTVEVVLYTKNGSLYDTVQSLGFFTKKDAIDIANWIVIRTLPEYFQERFGENDTTVIFKCPISGKRVIVNIREVDFDSFDCVMDKIGEFFEA
jgi:hypothetical protein